MTELTKEQEKILVAFCLHEKLNFQMVRKIFVQQTPKDQKEQLKDMKKTIKLTYNNSKSYAQFIKSASNDTKRSSLESSRKGLN